ncbi:MAG: hypothetical protein Fur0032_22650 [Terrimicrobiaceae bacterium]
MNPIHIARDGRALGRFDAQDVANGLADGKFLPSDLGWHDGLENWVTLASMEGLPEPSTAAPPSTAPLLDMPGTDSHLPEPAWERRGELGWVKAAVESVSAILGRPSEVFLRMPATGGLLGPLLFLLIVGSLTGWVAIAYSAVATFVNPASMGQAFKDFTPETIRWLFVASAVFLPFGTLIAAFVSAGLFHMGLKLFAKNIHSFETTLRVYCYAWGTASLLQLLPICGGYVYSALGIYLTIIGLRDAHKISAGQSSASVLIPFAICCGAVAIGVGFATMSGVR